MGRCDLAIFGLQNVGVSALQDARTRAGKALMRCETGGVFAQLAAAPAGLTCRKQVAA